MLAPIKRTLTADTTVSRLRVIVDLSEGLMAKGHKVTIFATEDSKLPGANIIGIAPTGLNFLPPAENSFYQHTAYLTMMISKTIENQRKFDIIHNHMYPEYMALLAESSFKTPLITTVHSQMVEETVQTLKCFPKANLVAISYSAKKAAGIEKMHVIHNAIDTDLFKPDQNIKKDYFLFIGRMSKAKDKNGKYLDPKGVQNVISIAEKLDLKLKIVGNVEERDFFEILVRPHLSDKIEFIGKVSPEQTLTRQQIVKLYQGAIAFLNPINWEEPFGLVMVEALACGTPVIAFNRGAVSEIVVNQKVGFVVDPKKGIDGLMEAVKNIDSINREVCREYAVSNFSRERMVDNYEKVYRQVLSR